MILRKIRSVKEEKSRKKERVCRKWRRMSKRWNLMPKLWLWLTGLSLKRWLISSFWGASWGKNSWRKIT
jgi:hypothetical protein